MPDAAIDMFQDFSTRAASCSEDIAQFNTMYVKSTDIFEHATQTRARDPSGIHRLPVTDVFLPDDLVGKETRVDDGDDVEMKDAAGKDAPAETEEPEEKEEVVEDTNDGDVSNVVDEFTGRLMHRDVEVEEMPGGTPVKRVLKVRYTAPTPWPCANWRQVILPPPTCLLFVIEITPAAEHSRAFVVSAVKNSKHPNVAAHHLHTGILRAVTVRQWPGNLEVLLEMLAAYKTIYSAKCDKCKRLTAGTKAELPMVRRLVRDGPGKEKRWIAMHEACV